MPFTTAADQVTRGRDVTLLASGVRTASNDSTGTDLGGASVLRCQVQVTAASGTSPTLDVTIQTSHDNGATDTWRTAGTAFAQLTGTGNSPWANMSVDRYVRVHSVVGGTTPSFTYTVVGEAV